MTRKTTAQGERKQQELDLGTLPNSVGYSIRRAQIFVFSDLIERFASFDLRPADFTVLYLIDINSEPSPSQIGDALGIKRANFVGLCRKLEQKGLIGRRPDTSDKRSQVLYLTPVGETLLAEMKDVERLHAQHVTRNLSGKEREAFVRLLNKLTGLS